MKRLIVDILLLLALITAGCGSDTTVVVTPTNAPPTITALRFSKDVTNNLILGSIDFVAPNVDLKDIAIITVNSSGVEVARTISDLSVFRGISSGTISFTIDYVTFPAGIYFFDIDVSDLSGALSNVVSGSFSVP
jgi:hypothetical protein